MTSIRRRIFLPLLALTAGALLLTALGIAAAVRRDLTLGLDKRLFVLAQALLASVDVNLEGKTEFELEIGAVPEFELPAKEAFYVVSDEDGSVIAAAPSPPGATFRSARGSPSYFTSSVRGRAFRVCLLSAPREPDLDERDVRRWLAEHSGRSLPRPSPRRIAVAVGLSTEGIRQTLSLIWLRVCLAFGSLLAALVLGPIWVVGRALRPLDRLSSEAERIGPEAPAARLDEAAVDREVRPLVAALNRALNRLGEAHDRERHFTSDAAHELRTPLAAIQANCEVALRRPRSAAELRETVEAIHGSALRLGNLVEKLLALARLDRGRPGLARGSADLGEAARAAVRLHREAAEEKGIELSADVPDEIPVVGDVFLLTECLSSLLENALRHTPAGGRVSLVAGIVPAPWAAVEDTGSGIPPEHLARIFDRFYRVESSRSRAEGGTGLGLAIARDIATLHGAELTVESQSGKGSRFLLRMPGNIGNTINGEYHGRQEPRDIQVE